MQIGIGLGLVTQALSGSSVDALLGGNPLDNYGNAAFLFDVPRSTYRNGATQVGSFSSLTGLTFTRASTGYAQTAGGVLVPFASGAPRITDKGLLIEGARTNLCLQSQTFDNASWTKFACPVTQDSGAAPDGTLTADLLIPTTGNTLHYVDQSVTHTAASYTVSLFYKPSGYTKIGVREGTTSGSYATFDCSGAGSIIATATSTATIAALGDGWYRCTMTWTGAAVSQSIRWFVMDNSYTSGSPHLYQYAGDGVSGGYLWGAQDELGAFPSSYIPTTTTSVTRAADVASIAVSGLAYPLTIWAEFEPSVISGAEQGIICVEKSGGLTDVAYIYQATSGAGTGLIYAASATQMSAAGAAFSAGNAYKVAMRIAANDGRYCQGGTLATLDSSVVLPNAPDRILLGQRYNLGGFQACGYLRRAAIWPTAFTDANLQAVTA